MKPIKMIVLIEIIFCNLSSFLCTAQQTNDWEILFNGKDLTGWRELNGKHTWEVKDGVIVGTDVPGQPNGFLCTEKEYTDFILEVEVSIDTQMNNSGVQFRSLSTADYLNGRVHGYQMEIDPKPQQWSGGIYEEGGSRQWLYTTHLNENAKKAFKNNQWNKYRIECFGNDIRTWINGIPVSHLIDDIFPKGFIGFQLHANQPMDPPGGNQVRFRNIRIKTNNLRPSPSDDVFIVNTIKNNLSAAEMKAGFALLWDGKTTKGWNSGDQQSNVHWKISNDALQATKSDSIKNNDEADLVTVKEYSFFILKFDFRYAKGTNSGVEYLVSDSKKQKDLHAAFEYQIIDDSIPGISRVFTLGSLAGLQAPDEPTHKFFLHRKTGEWNQGIIKVLPDNQVEYYLNGFKILSFKRGSAELNQWISQSELKDNPDFAKTNTGNIVLLGKGGEVSFRSIKIKELKAR